MQNNENNNENNIRNVFLYKDFFKNTASKKNIKDNKIKIYANLYGEVNK
jgi:hypothetical protein